MIEKTMEIVGQIVTSRTTVARIGRMLEFYSKNPMATADQVADHLCIHPMTVSKYRGIVRAAMDRAARGDDAATWQHVSDAAGRSMGE